MRWRSLPASTHFVHWLAPEHRRACKQQEEAQRSGARRSSAASSRRGGTWRAGAIHATTSTSDPPLRPRLVETAPRCWRDAFRQPGHEPDIDAALAATIERAGAAAAGVRAARRESPRTAGLLHDGDGIAGVPARISALGLAALATAGLIRLRVYRSLRHPAALTPVSLLIPRDQPGGSWRSIHRGWQELLRRHEGASLLA